MDFLHWELPGFTNSGLNSTEGFSASLYKNFKYK